MRGVTFFGVEKREIENAHSFTWLDAGGDGLSAFERRIYIHLLI